MSGVGAGGGVVATRRSSVHLGATLDGAIPACARRHFGARQHRPPSEITNSGLHEANVAHARWSEDVILLELHSPEHYPAPPPAYRYTFGLVPEQLSPVQRSQNMGQKDAMYQSREVPFRLSLLRLSASEGQTGVSKSAILPLETSIP